MSLEVILQIQKDNSEKIKIVEFLNDISDDFLIQARKAKQIGWDIETSGLDWSTESIGTCQISLSKDSVAIVQIGKALPPNLIELLSDKKVTKIFHHAMFDLRFMRYHWKAKSSNIYCTKIAAKLLNENNSFNNGLQTLLRHYLDVDLDKKSRIQKSDWLKNNLSKTQLFYAAEDVVYLTPLIERLHEILRKKKLLELALNCYHHLPTQVELEILGYKDIYSY